MVLREREKRCGTEEEDGEECCRCVHGNARVRRRHPCSDVAGDCPVCKKEGDVVKNELGRIGGCDGEVYGPCLLGSPAKAAAISGRRTCLSGRGFAVGRIGKNVLNHLWYEGKSRD